MQYLFLFTIDIDVLYMYYMIVNSLYYSLITKGTAMGNKSKKRNNVNAVKVDEVSTVAIAIVDVPAFKTVKVNLLDVFEKYTPKWLTALVLTFINGSTRDLTAMFTLTAEYILSTFTLNVDSVYVISRQTFLNTFCKVNGVSPSLSTGTNKTENKTVSMYGQGVIDTFPVVFDVDKMYTRVSMNGWNTFVEGGINFFHVKGNVYIMAHSLYTQFIEGTLTVDVDAISIDVDGSKVPMMYKETVDGLEPVE